MISIITATFNNLRLSQAYWESLLAHPPAVPWEIIWIDDCSSDGTRDWLQSIKTVNCKVILNPKNRGFAYSNNLGAKATSGDFLCFLNNDLILSPNWHVPMLEVFATGGNNLGIVGNVQVTVSTGLIDHAGVGFDLVGNPVHLHKGERLHQLKGKGNYCNAVTAACCLIKKNVFQKAGGFNQEFMNGNEDIDLCLRLNQLNFTHYTSYQSIIAHHVSASPGRKAKECENQAIFLQKWAQRTSKYGQKDWPISYIKHSLNEPKKINLTKLIDAMLRILKVRHGDSKWAAERRARLKNPATYSH